jgi:cytochrome c oxidase assembly protein subunit 15
MIHRYFAGFLSILIIAIIILSFLKQNRTRAQLTFAASFVMLISYQIILGQLTVTLKLMPVIVVGHLLGGFLILSVLWLIFLNCCRYLSCPSSVVRGGIQCGISTATPASFSNIFFACLGVFLLLLQIMLGAWTSTNYAALSCPDFPFCFNANPFFTMDFQNAFQFFVDKNVNYEGGILSDTARQTIHMMHRIGALIVTVYIFLFTCLLQKKLNKSLIFTIWGLLTLQIFLGIVNVIFQLPILTAVCHTIVASLLLLSLVTLVYQLQKRG